MYHATGSDRVEQLSDLPRSSPGAPLPWVLANETSVVVAYRVDQPDPDWDGSYTKVVSDDSDGETIALVRFRHAYAHMFGPPNDEAFYGHPLYAAGLRPYGTFEVSDSSWISALSDMNSVHPYHRPERFRERRHIVLAFHDSTFECCCSDYDVRLRSGSMRSSVSAMADFLDADG